MVEKQVTNLRLIAWELTRDCNLSCQHCRASSGYGPHSNEWTTQECLKLVDEISFFARPIIILTGGEPLLRKDIFEIAAYCKSKGLITVMAPNGTLLTQENIKKIIASGVRRISVSLDGAQALTHNELRQAPGAFEAACRGLALAKNAGLEFQVNSTITKRNIQELPQLINLAKDLSAKAHHIFLLVPTGRAKDMAQDELSAQEYEEALEFLAKEKKNFKIEIKITCAPHFNRVLLQSRGAAFSELAGRGCMGGVSFCFISHIGEVQPCGYLELNCGNVRKDGFKKVWEGSRVLNNIRDWGKYKGKCGHCEFKSVCGGCRARAYAKYGDYLREEPYCIYEPMTSR